MTRWISDRALDRLRQAAAEPDLSGTKYRLLGQLGQGGVGAVFRARDTQLSRDVALKVIRVPDADGELTARLIREARVIAQLEHPGIVPIHDVGTLPDGRVFYTMKWVQGKRLDEYVRQMASLPESLRLFGKICEAISFAHAHGVLHRDLKPQNVMVGPFGEVLVMDWGLSKIVSAPPLTVMKTSATVAAPAPDQAETVSGTAHGSVIGTPGYMSPEQARGDIVAVDQRSDVFSLGAVLNFLAEAAPHHAPPPLSLVAIVSKAMADDPAARYPSVQDLGQDVANYLDGLPVIAYPEGIVSRALRWAGRNQAWLLLVLAYIVMRAALILWRPR
jgi:serine/threonine protein kinase